ncbi:hypothetical protein V6N12_003603 [Hibiscus sabdariffa]|uniref:Uncharacterized protein n=1 Tax=Hibiscus sabdariffa TaxID=183260 RepID=A0ABR2B2R8_9ROSI
MFRVYGYDPGRTHGKINPGPCTAPTAPPINIINSGPNIGILFLDDMESLDYVRFPSQRQLDSDGIKGCRQAKEGNDRFMETPQGFTTAPWSWRLERVSGACAHQRHAYVTGFENQNVSVSDSST